MNQEKFSPEIELAIDLIRCPSVTPLEGGALDLLEKRLSAYGFICERMKFSGNGGTETDNLYARYGKAGKFFCFAGHTDVVPPGDEAGWVFPPFAGRVEDGVLYGRGAADMKGAIAAFIIAFQNILARQPKFPHSVALLITGDEEGAAVNGTRKMIETLIKRNEKPDACIVGEPTNPDYAGQMIKTGRRGSLNGIVTLAGAQGHVAYPHKANNPVHHMIDFLALLKSGVLDQGNDFFQPSNLEITSVDVGNSITNVIPAEAKARFNVRFSSEYSGETLCALLKNKAQVFEKERSVKIHLEFLRPWGESFLTQGADFIETLNDAIEAETGRRAELSTTGGTSDARFIKDLCPVIEYGAVGATMHQVNESAAIEDIVTLRKIYENFLERFFT